MSETLTSDDLTIRVLRTATDDFRLEWTGKSNSRDPGRVLIPFFDELLGRAAGHRIEMHFEHLEHFNSSTIAALIQMINAATRAQIGLRIHYDQTLRWQALSFDALRRAIRPFDESDHPVEFFGDAAGARA